MRHLCLTVIVSSIFIAALARAEDKRCQQVTVDIEATITICSQPTGPQPPETPPAGPRWMPWMECNMPLWNAVQTYGDLAGVPADATVRDYTVLGLEVWSQVTDAAIVTTHWGQLQNLYPPLMERVADRLAIYGGIKPRIPGCWGDDPAKYDFADAASWQRVAEMCQRIAQLTGTNVCVLETEEVLSPFHHDGAMIDLRRLEAALQPLAETGIEYWWDSPVVLPECAYPGMQVKTTALVAVVARAVPNSRFLTAYSMYADPEFIESRAEARQRMIDVVGLDRMDERWIVRLDGVLNGRLCYTPAGFVVAAGLLDAETIGIYPCSDQWLAVAQELARLQAAVPAD